MEKLKKMIPFAAISIALLVALNVAKFTPLWWIAALVAGPGLVIMLVVEAKAWGERMNPSQPASPGTE